MHVIKNHENMKSNVCYYQFTLFLLDVLTKEGDPFAMNREDTETEVKVVENGSTFGPVSLLFCDNN